MIAEKTSPKIEGLTPAWAEAAAPPTIAEETFRKIEVLGEISLGLRHKLVQKPRAAEGKNRVGTGSAIPIPGTGTLQREEAGSLGEILDSSFSDHPIGELSIKNSGLVTSFGIFGAPGCGKTVLLMHMLKQVLGHQSGDVDKRYGALILDPKAALRKDVTKIVEDVGRSEDLRIINTIHLNRKRKGGGVNAIDCSIDPYELGAILVLAGRSAGIDASDPFWFQEWTNLFTASLSVLRKEEELRSPAERRPVTLRKLLDAIFDEAPKATSEDKPERVIQLRARQLEARLASLPADERADVLMDLQTLRRFYREGNDNIGTIEAFVTKAFGMFRRSRLRCYSDDTPYEGRPPFYEDIVENGRVVLVSISPSEPVLAKTLCTLIKCLFQRTVLARRELHSSGIITNTVRPLVIACDEYSEIASEVAGQSMGDGQFLALAREYGCMAILATQSVNVLQASSLRDTWRSVFSNFAAKIYMRLVDNETAEEASKLAGESDWNMNSQTRSYGESGTSLSRQRDLRERKNLPSTILTQVLKRGQAVVIGSLDGGETTPGMYFLSVPRPGDSCGPAPETRKAATHG
jgi:hypothetical protein